MKIYDILNVVKKSVQQTKGEREWKIGSEWLESYFRRANELIPCNSNNNNSE